MGNRLSGLWCKKTTLNISSKSEEKENPQIATDKSKRTRRKSSGSGGGSVSDGFRGTFRLGSVRRLSLTKDNHKKGSASSKSDPDPGISTIEHTYRELIQNPIHTAADPSSNSMKVNPQLLPSAVKINLRLMRQMSRPAVQSRGTNLLIGNGSGGGAAAVQWHTQTQNLSAAGSCCNRENAIVCLVCLWH
ncbi:GL25408 [Drosophila persimilis]|uniref:GL25408 n=1 Tax=Drosophila persimilis TaxID=7234 RepID=B4H8R2_DROPE|nr:GL25408 [Drosophila persimilis]